MSSRIVIASTAEAVAYAPQLIAEQLGFLVDEGLAVEYRGGGNPEGLARAVAAGRADFALGGIWRPLHYKDVLGEEFVSFAKVASQPISGIFGRLPAEEFDWRVAEGGGFLVSSVHAPSPWFYLQAVLRAKGVDPGRVQLVLGLPVAESHHLFREGYGVLIEASDLGAVPLLRDEALHPLVNWDRDLGSIPESVYFATAAGLAERRPQARALARAIGRALDWIEDAEAAELAEVVARGAAGFSSRPDAAAVATVVEMYVEQRLWLSDPSIPRHEFERWSAALVEAGWLSAPPAYEQLVDVEITTAAAAEARGGR